MEGSSGPPDRRTFTPAIIASVLFVAACAVFAITFTAARGGLELPVASRSSPVAAASPGPTEPPRPTVAPTVPATPEPTLITLPPPTISPSPAPTVAPTAAVTPAPTAARPTLEPGDPLLALPACPDHPGCFLYVVQRGDTLSGIISRYLLDIDVLLVLNPELDNPNVVVVGETLFLGRDPYARLDPCPDTTGGCWLYVVRSGDSLARIASTFGLTTDAILAFNPDLPRPIQPGQVIRLPEAPSPS